MLRVMSLPTSAATASRVRLAPVLALAWLVANVALAVALGRFFRTSGSDDLDLAGPVEIVETMVVIVGGSALGASVAARYPRNPVGWLFLGLFALYALDSLLSLYVLLATATSRVHGDVGAAFEQGVFIVMFGLIATMILVFPNGRPPPGRRWSRVLGAVVVVFPLEYVVNTFLARPHLKPPLADHDDPLVPGWVPEGLGSVLNHGLLLTCLLLMFSSFASIGARRKASDPIQRQQLKWMVLAALTLPASLLVCWVIRIFFGSAAFTAVIGAFFDVVLVAITGAAALAVSRYRLYSVDRVVDTALVHLTLTAVLVAGYAAIVLTSTHLFSDGTSFPPVAVAAATLVVAVAAAPLRRFLQRLVNRRFHRRSHDAVRVVDEFVKQLRDDEAQLDLLEAVLRRATGDLGLELGLWQSGPDLYLRPDGSELGDVDPSRALFHVERGDGPIAVLVHDPALSRQLLLLEDVARAAALPIDNARLQVEVLAQLAEVQASRQRIVSATFDERRRIERDLHDGAQARLVSIALNLSLARDRVDPESARVLDQLAVELQTAVTEVRELARGIHPQALVDDGLLAALESLADRTPVAVTVDVPDVSLPDVVASTAYFVACEAVTNAVKHAGASTVAVRAAVLVDHLLLSISDDGRGGATARPGGGLQGLADRVQAVGGVFGLISELGRGTTVTVEVPCVP